MTIFEKIVAGEIPSYTIAEDDRFMAFLDVFPLRKGHTLVIPKKATDYIFNLDDTSLADLMVFAKKVALAMDKSIECTRIGVAVIGLEVPHVHIHLVPINGVADIDFSQPKLKLATEDFQDIAARIKANL